MRTVKTALLFASTLFINAKANAGEVLAELSFRQGSCGKSFYYNEVIRCDCPQGNRNLQCLQGARITVRPAKNELGGRGYLVIHAQQGNERYVLSGRRWAPILEAGPNAFSAVFPVLSGPVSVDLPLPSVQEVEVICRTGEPLTLFAFFGVASREDVEMVEKMRSLAAAGEKRADDDSLFWTRARIRTIRRGGDGWSKVAVLSCGQSAR